MIDNNKEIRERAISNLNSKLEINLVPYEILV